jgi:hypothetical protein
MANGGVDTRIYETLGQQGKGFNPFETYMGMQNLLMAREGMDLRREENQRSQEMHGVSMENAMLTQQRLQRAMAQEQKLSEIAMNAIDPDTGQFDINKFLDGVVADPLVASNAAEVFAKAVNTKRIESETAALKLQTAINKNDQISIKAASLLDSAKGRNVKASEISGAIADLYQEGVLTKDEALNALGSFGALKEGPDLDTALERVASESGAGREVLKENLERFKTRLGIEVVQREIQQEFDKSAANVEQLLETISGIKGHPSIKSATGWGAMLNWVPESERRDFNTRVNQIKGQTFMRAYETLKGGGQITEIEGQQAREAIARLDPFMQTEDFKVALDELETVIRKGYNRLREQHGLSTTESLSDEEILERLGGAQ